MDVCFRLSVMLKKKIGGVEGKKKKIVAVAMDLSRALPCPIFSQIFSVFGNKDSAFFVKIADFALMGPKGLLAAVAQLFAATSMV